MRVLQTGLGPLNTLDIFPHPSNDDGRLAPSTLGLTPDEFIIYQLPQLAHLPIDQHLSPLARQGLFRVLNTATYLDCATFHRFFINPVFKEHPTLINDIFEMVAQLSALGVKGFEKSFSPLTSPAPANDTDAENSFLDERSFGSLRRILGKAAEYRQALRIAQEPNVHAVYLTQEEPIDWNQLSASEEHHLQHVILKHMPEVYRRTYNQQKKVVVDLTYTDNHGARFVVEVKSYLGRLPYAQSDLARRAFIEAMRLALVARQNGYAGIDYRIECGYHSGSGFVNGLEYALRAMGVAYRIRVFLRS